MAMVMLVIGLLVQIASVPPPVEQTTADCARPVYATDMLVCGDPELKRLDAQLQATLASQQKAVSSPLLEDPVAWFKRSRRCAFLDAHRACAIAAYAEALSVRQTLATPTAPSSLCQLADGSAAGLAKISSGAALVENGKIIGYGMTDASFWHPFIRYVRTRRGSIFRSLAGKTVAVCRSDVR